MNPYPEAESGLSKFPLLWMIGEAKKHELEFNTQSINQLGWGHKRKGSPFDYVRPDQAAKPHKSLRGGWQLIEFIPKKIKYREWPARRSWFGFYFPRGEPRPVEQAATVHESVLKHKGVSPDYAPPNLPPDFVVEKLAKQPIERTTEQAVTSIRPKQP